MKLVDTSQTTERWVAKKSLPEVHTAAIQAVRLARQGGAEGIGDRRGHSDQFFLASSLVST